jgi:hypothetical protein
LLFRKLSKFIEIIVVDSVGVAEEVGAGGGGGGAGSAKHEPSKRLKLT